MTHLWSPAASQASCILVAFCGIRLDELGNGDSIREQPPVDCGNCLAASSGAPRKAPPVPDFIRPGNAETTYHLSTCTLGRHSGACSLDGPVHPAGRREQRIAFLETSRPKLVDYLKMKLEAEDWHGVQDAASDLRDLDNELDGLRY